MDQACNPRPMRLLAVDDNSDSAELIARLASKCGYYVRTITDPHAMREVLDGWKPEVVTLDLCMPEQDGIGTFATLKECGFRGDLIIISGQDGWLRKTAGRLAFAQGLKVADDLQKPVDLTVLRTLLTRLKASAR